MFSIAARLNHDHVFVHGLYDFPASVYVLPHVFYVQLQLAVYVFVQAACAVVPKVVYVAQLNAGVLARVFAVAIAFVGFVPIHDAQFRACDVLILPVVGAVDIPNADDHSHNVDHHNHGDVHNEDHSDHRSDYLKEMRHSLRLKKQ